MFISIILYMFITLEIERVTLYMFITLEIERVTLYSICSLRWNWKLRRENTESGVWPYLIMDPNRDPSQAAQLSLSSRC